MAEPILNFAFIAIFWRMYNMYIGLDCSKMLTMAVFDYPEIKNIISANSDVPSTHNNKWNFKRSAH